MSLKLAFIGTGQIAGWHLNGIAALNEHNRRNDPNAETLFELVALCDPRPEACASLAQAAEEKLGRRPTVFNDYQRLLEKESLDAAALLVPHHLHWPIAKDCMDAGLHLQVQKPIAITIGDGRHIIDYARGKNKAMVVSEPSVLGRGTRALIAALRDGALIGAPTMLLDYAVTTLGGGFFMGTPWRHLKGLAGAGWFLDHGVHRTHWFLEALGSVESAFAFAHTFEPQRRDEKHGAFDVDTEDCAMAALRFQNGALGHFLVASAGQGAGFGGVRLYGTEGMVDLSGGTAQKQGGAVQKLDELTAPYRDENLPGDAMAHSFLELHQLITQGAPPISTGERALEALAVIYACLEASMTHQSVRVSDVLSGASHDYEDTIEEARPQWADALPSQVS
jgi:UDP-N-acetyl-2-amino-2-deoxyglucuronate dehydrogenase